MKIVVELQVTYNDDVYSQPMSGGFTTHVINLNNEAALERLVEHFQGPALDNFPLSLSDIIPYDIEID